jgi:hypothetical protein
VNTNEKARASEREIEEARDVARESGTQTEAEREMARNMKNVCVCVREGGVG